MKEIGGWFRQLGNKLITGLRKFMAGRYGTDKLNMVILGAGVITCLVSLFVKNYWVNIALIAASYGLMIWAIFRSLSRNTYKRYQENRRFLMLLERVKDRNHRYYDCPRCRQQVRVPRGKGKIAITCPRCKEKFVKKT